MHPGYQRVRSGNQLVPRWNTQQRCIISDAERHVGARHRLRREVGSYDLELVHRRCGLHRGASGAYLVWTQRVGNLVEYGIDVLVTVLGAKGLGQFDRLVQYDAVGNLGMKFKLVGTNAQAGEFHGIYVVHRPIEMRNQVIVEFVLVERDFAQQLMEKIEIDPFHLMIQDIMALDIPRRLAGELPLVEGLQCSAAREMPSALHCAGRFPAHTISS